MKRKRLILTVQIFSILLLLLSLIGGVAVVMLSQKGDIVDRNSGWVVATFFISIGLLIYSHYIPDGSYYKKKTDMELMKEIKKSYMGNIKVKGYFPKKTCAVRNK